MKQSQDRVGQAAGRLRFGRAPIATIVAVEVKDQMKSEAGGDVCSSSDSYEEVLPPQLLEIEEWDCPTKKRKSPRDLNNQG